MRAVVAREAFQAGDLGERCVCTGVPTTDRAVVQARYLPRWPLWALLAAPWGIPVALGLTLLIGRHVTGVVPCSRQAARLVRRRRRVGWMLTLAVVVIGGAVARWAGSRLPGDLTVAWLLAVAGGFALALRASLRPAGSILARLDRSGRFVILDGVSPVFAAAQADEVSASR